MNDWLIPDWPAPAQVKACVTTRAGGVSLAPFDSLNLGDHVEDSLEAVLENRRRLSQTFDIQPAWLRQVYGVNVVKADPGRTLEADGCWTDTPGIACTAMTADCLPALFCNRAGTRVAAAHAGWRGLAAGVLEATVDSLAVEPDDVLVWLGPAIGPQAFEVGPEVREVFMQQLPAPGRQPRGVGSLLFKTAVISPGHLSLVKGRGAEQTFRRHNGKGPAS
jgi:YfiH family protein